MTDGSPAGARAGANEAETLVAEARARIVAVADGIASGWAYARPGEAVRVQLRVGDRVVGEGVADLPDEALSHAGLGDGRHAFRIAIEAPFRPGQTVRLVAHDADSGRPLLADPFPLGCRDPAHLAEDELDGRSVRARPPRPSGLLRPPRSSKRLRKVIGRLVRPAARLGRRRRVAPVDPVAPAALHPGALARLARLEDTSVNGLEQIGHWPPLKLPACERPDVSLVVPVHDQFHLTYQCLASVILAAGDTRFEVLLVDDCSNDATRAIETRVENLRVLRNERNLGFLGSCMRGASAARGEYLLFLNNDTEVEPGWLDEMHDVFARFDRVGAVGAKLVYPDGRLQDAGGIVWDSGVPWNVGHGRDPDDPEFNYVREVDYLTGAALMVRRSAWQEVGGFSEGYAPAYYEDTDLAFKLREAGWRTLYCPQARVVHHEGCSNGKSIDSGVKRHQVINAERFRETWRERFAGLGAEGVDLAGNKDRRRGLRALVIDHEYPRLGSDAGSYAAVREMRLLLDLGCKVTFLPYNLAWAGRHVDVLQRLGIECVHAPWLASVESFLERRGAEFDLVYVTRYTVAERVVPIVRRSGRAKVIFNNADLHFLREMRGAIERGESDLAAPRRTRERELAVMAEADAVLSYSDVERAIIGSHLLRDDHVFACPWVLDVEPSAVPLERREHIAFLGGFAHPPNREAMDWFIENVMPPLRAARPALELHVWGSKLPEGTGWGERDGVVLRGYACSLDEVFDGCRVFVAPLRSGAGIKGKVLDSIARGVPTVLSAIAAEGTGLVDGASTLVATTPGEWVEAILRATDDEALWRRLSSASLELAETRYSHEHGLARFREVLAALALDPCAGGGDPFRRVLAR